MIDRKSRNILAQNLRQYLSCRITNDTLRYSEIGLEDKAVKVIYDFSMHLYADLKEHKAEGDYQLLPEGRAMAKRCILFLYSDETYQWPKFCFNPFFHFVLDYLTLGIWIIISKYKLKQFKTAGNFSCWPFISEQQMNKALTNPKLLNG